MDRKALEIIPKNVVHFVPIFDTINQLLADQVVHLMVFVRYHLVASNREQQEYIQMVSEKCIKHNVELFEWK